MSTRMQQRRGTSAQWTSADPVLAAGEIGFATDLKKFKMGDGTSKWSELTYYSNADEVTAAINSVVGMAPETLNTLSEISDALGDDPNFLSALVTKTAFDAASLDAIAQLNSSINAHNNNTTSVHGIANTANLATKTYADNAVSTHEADTTNVHGIADTSSLVTTTTTQTLTNKTLTSPTISSPTGIVKSDVGLGNVDNTSDVNKPVSNAQSSAIATAKTEAITAAGSAADTKISTHNSASTNVHGISDTTELATKTYADAIGTTATNALALKAPLASPTFTGTVSGITKTMVGLGNADNTSDVNKPVSIATQTALDLKANLASPTFTGTLTAANATITGNLTVSGTTTTVNATNLEITDPLIYMATGNAANANDIGIVGHATISSTYQHLGFVRDHTDGKWKLFSGVTTEPGSGTINLTGATYDTLKVGALEATTVTPSSGVVFSDGTQTLEGVPSRTPIVQKTASYTLSALSERDSVIEISSTSATTLTVPSNSTIAYPIGTSIDILQTNTGQVSVAGAAGVTVNATPGLKLRTQWSGATLFKRATDTWVLYGDLSA